MDDRAFYNEENVRTAIPSGVGEIQGGGGRTLAMMNCVSIVEFLVAVQRKKKTAVNRQLSAHVWQMNQSESVQCRIHSLLAIVCILLVKTDPIIMPPAYACLSNLTNPKIIAALLVLCWVSGQTKVGVLFFSKAMCNSQILGTCSEFGRDFHLIGFLWFGWDCLKLIVLESLVCLALYIVQNKDHSLSLRRFPGPLSEQMSCLEFNELQIGKNESEQSSGRQLKSYKDWNAFVWTELPQSSTVKFTSADCSITVRNTFLASHVFPRTRRVSGWKLSTEQWLDYLGSAWDHAKFTCRSKKKRKEKKHLSAPSVRWPRIKFRHSLIRPFRSALAGRFWLPLSVFLRFLRVVLSLFSVSSRPVTCHHCLPFLPFSVLTQQQLLSSLSAPYEKLGSNVNW